MIDATGSIEDQQMEMRKVVMEQFGEAIASGQILHKEGAFRVNTKPPAVL